MRTFLQRRWRFLATFALILLVCVNLALQCYHRLAFGHFVPIGLHVDAESEVASIGIPGQTHLYWAQLTNVGPWPVWFAACDYVSDTLTPGTDYP